MQKWIFSLSLACALFALPARAVEETVCEWHNERDGFAFESVLNRRRLSTALDCANAAGYYMLRFEPIRGATMLDGTLILKRRSDNAIIARCVTRTVRPINEAERRRLPLFVFNLDEARVRDFQRRFPQVRSLTEDESVAEFRLDEWQARFREYFTVECDAPQS